jgi:hypothetical protein
MTQGLVPFNLIEEAVQLFCEHTFKFYQINPHSLIRIGSIVYPSTPNLGDVDDLKATYTQAFANCIEIILKKKDGYSGIQKMLGSLYFRDFLYYKRKDNFGTYNLTRRIQEVKFEG